MEVLGKETNSVGLNISTKKIGSNFREDITDEYKFKEGRHKYCQHTSNRHCSRYCV